MLLIIFYKQYTFQRGNLFTWGPSADQYMNLSRKKKVLKTLNNLKKSKSKLAALLFTGVLPVQIKEKERKMFQQECYLTGHVATVILASVATIWKLC